ncbi:YcaO-like family protein [Bauldia litoralis]|uniref:YcaO-like family protein n=1 Tax=Bauldia litoralis TaxID=665467 RepID=UPI003298F698
MQAETLPAGYEGVFDPGVGIVSALDRIAEAPDAPRYVHLRARLCNVETLGGVATSRSVEVAAVDRPAAVLAALGAGVSHYCAAMYQSDGLPVDTAVDAAFPCIAPADFALFSEGQYARPGYPYVPFLETTPVKWTGAVDLATGETVHAPAAMVWFPFRYARTAGDQPIVCSDPGGLACSQGVAAAALSGLCDVVARDAAALFWQAGIQAPQVRIETLPPRLRDMIDRFRSADDPVTILDVTTDNRIPAFVAVVASQARDRPAHVFAVAARLDPADAVADALCRLAANRRSAIGITASLTPPEANGDWEDVVTPADHAAFAADHDNRPLVAASLASDEACDLDDHENATTGSVDGDLEAAIGRVMATGYRVYAANLTGVDIGALGLNVVRTIVPGYLPLFAGHHLRPLGARRLYDAPQKLGHRGITETGGGNTAPHPFL